MGQLVGVLLIVRTGHPDKNLRHSKRRQIELEFCMQLRRRRRASVQRV